MFLDSEYRLEKHAGYENHRLKTVLIYSYMMWVDLRTYFLLPSVFLWAISIVSDTMDIAYKNTRSKNMLDIRTCMEFLAMFL